jgi:hypothetical protein
LMEIFRSPVNDVLSRQVDELQGHAATAAPA